eukprot:11451708-Karenia_brevis.AAC.1
MRIFIEDAEHTTVPIAVEPDDTTAIVKQKIQVVSNIDCESQHLYFNEMELEDTATLAESNITHRCTIQLVVPPGASSTPMTDKDVGSHLPRSDGHIGTPDAKRHRVHNLGYPPHFQHVPLDVSGSSRPDLHPHSAYPQQGSE